jgi:hypothetical protein
MTSKCDIMGMYMRAKRKEERQDDTGGQSVQVPSASFRHQVCHPIAFNSRQQVDRRWRGRLIHSLINEMRDSQKPQCTCIAARSDPDAFGFNGSTTHLDKRLGDTGILFWKVGTNMLLHMVLNRCSSDTTGDDGETPQTNKQTMIIAAT